MSMSEVFEWQDFQARFRLAAEANGFLATTLAELDAGNLVVWEKLGIGPRIYLSAGIHGDEPAGPLALLDLLRGGFFSEHFHWLLCPALNPTGLAAHTRENIEGVDMNRDYFRRSTREVRAHAAWLDALETPDLFISLHEDWETQGFYFYEINLGSENRGRTRRILESVAQWFSPEPGPVIDGHAATAPGWIYHASEPDVPEGWPEAIHLAKKGCPLSFTFETPSRAPLPHRVAAHAAAVRAACQSVRES